MGTPGKVIELGEDMGLFGPKRHTKSIGQQTEAAIITKLLEVGYNVLIPYLGENLRYDLVIEDADGKFWRVQCKTGKLHNSQEYIEFNAASSYYYHRKEGTTWGANPITVRSTTSPSIVPILGVSISYRLTMSQALRGGCVYFLRTTSKRRTFAGPKSMSYKKAEKEVRKGRYGKDTG